MVELLRVLRARRSYLAAIALATAGITVTTSATPASAAVANPGVVTMLANATLHTEALDVKELPLRHAAAGTVDGSGNVVISQLDLEFETQDTEIDASDPTLDDAIVHATIQPASALTGTVDPELGTMSLSGDLVLMLSADGMFTNCPVGPFPVNLQTSQRDGVPYDSTSGGATLADATFSMPAIPFSQPGCTGWESRLNTAFKLPSAPEDAALLLPIVLSPAVVAVPPDTTTTATMPTTIPPSSSTSATTAAATTTAAPTTGATSQPRAAATSPRKAPAAKPAPDATTTPPTTASPPTTEPLRDRRAVVTPMTLPGTSAPPTTTPRAPHQLAADTRAVSNRFPSGPVVFALALLLGGIGIVLIASELRAMRGPRRRRAARAH